MAKKKEIESTIESMKITPICAECDYCYPYIEKGLFKKIRHAGCSAQGYQLAHNVYGTENCRGAFEWQIQLPQIKTTDIDEVK